MPVPLTSHLAFFGCTDRLGSSPRYRSISANVGTQPGKSSLAVQFVDGHFVDSYYPTIENTFSKTIRYKGQDFATEIVDTAGQVGAPGYRLAGRIPDNKKLTLAAAVGVGRIQHPELEAFYRHPWIHACVFRLVTLIL